MPTLTIDEIKDILLFCKEHGITAIEIGQDMLKACVNPAEATIMPQMPTPEPYTVPEWE
jgi:hypothetical protein